eukprot:1298387-Rhodomonas_salina.3
MYGGSFASGKSLRPFVVFPSKPALGWMLGAPLSSWTCSATNKQHILAHSWNESGGSTSETFLKWLKAQFYMTHDPKGQQLHHMGALFRESVDDPVVVLLDGHGSHWSVEVLQFCIDNGIHLVLRQPHTSHVCQGEDVINFWKLKQEIHKSCWTELSVRAMSTLLNKKGTSAPVSLMNEDLMGCVKKQWESAFSKSNCSTAWRVTGFEPFTQRVYWQLKALEDAKELQSQRTELATGLNISNFTLNSL